MILPRITTQDTSIHVEYYVKLLNVLAVDVHCRAGNNKEGNNYIMLCNSPAEKSAYKFYSHAKLLLFTYVLCIEPLLKLLVSQLQHLEDPNMLLKQLDKFIGHIRKNYLESNGKRLYLVNSSNVETASLKSNSVFVFLSKLTTEHLMTDVQPTSLIETVQNRVKGTATWFSETVQDVATTALKDVDASLYPNLYAAKKGTLCDVVSDEKNNIITQTEKFVDQLRNASYAGNASLWNSTCLNLRSLYSARGILYLDVTKMFSIINTAKGKGLNTQIITSLVQQLQQT